MNFEIYKSSHLDNHDLLGLFYQLTETYSFDPVDPSVLIGLLLLPYCYIAFNYFSYKSLK